MRNAFIRTIHDVTKKNEDIIVMAGDLGDFLFRHYIKEFPNNFFNMGIAEANMMGVAAGFAQSGKIPFVYSITPFVTARCFEQIKVDVCYSESNVKIVGVGSGITYGTLGSTHHSLEDIAIMVSLPNMVVLSPSDPIEAEEATRAAVLHSSPVYIRLGSNSVDLDYKRKKFEIGKARIVRQGDSTALLTTGDTVMEALKAAEILEKKGINCYVVNFHTIKPIDARLIKQLLKECRVLISVEEHSTFGGFGSVVASVIAQEPKSSARFKIMGFDDVFCKHYSKDKSELYDKYKISAKHIAREVVKLHDHA